MENKCKQKVLDALDALKVVVCFNSYSDVKELTAILNREILNYLREAKV